MDNVCYLIHYTETEDSIGQATLTPHKRKVFCRVESVSGSEWFSGGQNGLRPELRLTVFRYDYEDEKTVELDGSLFSVYRTYADGDFLELYLERKVGDER